MALKDLVADHKKVAEETIEKIIGPYVRYDPAAQKIVWTAQSKSLSNDAKVLVFLVAVLGWHYVSEEKITVKTKPANLESDLGIPGGTLRPVLKKLKDGHLLTEVSGQYAVQLANIDAIENAIAGNVRAPTKKSSSRKSGRTKPEKAEDEGADVKSSEKRKSRGAPNQLKTLLTKWISDGFFKEPRTMSNLLERYHENAVIAKLTSLSGLLLDAVRDGLLIRTKIDVQNKKVWAYSAPKK